MFQHQDNYAIAQCQIKHIITCMSNYRQLESVGRGSETQVFNYKKTDVGKLCALLSDLPYFNTATHVTDIDAAWDTWLQHYNKSVSECVPQVYVRKSNALRGSTPKLYMSSKKNIVWKIAKASDLKEDWDKFKKIRNNFK